jgi:lipoprotein-releasing system permease protein
MLFAFKVAQRYLFSNKMQTFLLIAGVAIGVMVYVYITGLLNGLKDRLVSQITGNIAHVVMEPADRTAHVLPGLVKEGERPLAVIQPPFDAREQIRNPESYVSILKGLPWLTIISPEVVGSGFLVRSEVQKPVSITGLEPEQLAGISQIEQSIIAGEARLDLTDILIGEKLAKDLGLHAGQSVVLASERGRQVTRTVRGLFRTGLDSLDQRVIYMNLKSARNLLDLDQGLSRIQVRVDDLYKANEYAEILRGMTGLKVTSWIESNARFFDALDAQGRSGTLIRSFSLITIIIGVASALLLTTYRRKAEIGIMRSFGVSQRFIMTVFIAQGALVGLIGSVIGASLGYVFSVLMLTMGVRSDGTPLIPIDPAQGGYTQVVVLTILGSMLAAILPARAASKIDPVEAIGA